MRMDLPPKVRQPVKTQSPLNGELSHGINGEREAGPHVHNFADSEQRGSEGGAGDPASCEQSHYAGSLCSGGYAEQEAGTKQTCSDGTQQGRGTGLTGPNWTMTQFANSLQVLERIGGDDGTRTRGLCRDRAAF